MILDGKTIKTAEKEGDIIIIYFTDGTSWSCSLKGWCSSLEGENQ